MVDMLLRMMALLQIMSDFAHPPNAVGASRMRYHSAPARRSHIMNLVQEAGHYSARDLSRALGVSEMTARRDIRLLAGEGLVKAVYGGVSSLSPSLNGVDFRLRAKQHVDAKRAIARAARSLVRANSTIALDAGTTAFELARSLPHDQNLTVVTHSLPVMHALASRTDIELIGLGGLLHPESQSFAGPLTVAALRNLRVATLFLAASAVDDDAMFCGNLFDAETKRALIEAADETVLIVDASKFGRTATVRVGPTTGTHTIVVDDALDPRLVGSLRSQGIRIIVARPHVDAADPEAGVL